VLKSFSAILLLLSFFAQTFNEAFIVFGFYANQSYIAANLCENRYRPMLHCNGKCLLAKKLKQEEKRDQQNPGRKLESKSEVISCCSVLAANLSFFSTNKHHYCIYSEKDTIDFSFSFFHPPSV
jgi:hypothetical protein